MIRTLEVAWLCITIISFGLTIFQFFKEGIQSGLFIKAGILPISVDEVYLDVKGKKQKRNYIIEISRFFNVK